MQNDTKGSAQSKEYTKALHQLERQHYWHLVRQTFLEDDKDADTNEM